MTHGKDTLERMLLSAEQRAILAEKRAEAEKLRADKAEGALSKWQQFARHAKGAFMLLSEVLEADMVDEFISRYMKRAGR